MKLTCACGCARFYYIVTADVRKGGVYVDTATVELECWQCGTIQPQRFPHYPVDLINGDVPAEPGPEVVL